MKKSTPGEEQIKSESIPVICRSFYLNMDSGVIAENPNDAFDAMRQALIQKIGQMLREERAKLKSLLYRIDVDESRLGEKLRLGEKGSEAEVIADEIIRRQMQKIRTRIMYREGKL